MKNKKSDGLMIKEARENGMVVSMKSEEMLKSHKDDLAVELEDYFKRYKRDYEGMFDEDESEDILFKINEFIDDNEINTYQFHFPVFGGVDNRLLKITDNLQLLVVISDEYFGDGDYSKYVDINKFIINDSATYEDVDTLIGFIDDYLEN